MGRGRRSVTGRGLSEGETQLLGPAWAGMAKNANGGEQQHGIQGCNLNRDTGGAEKDMRTKEQKTAGLPVA